MMLHYSKKSLFWSFIIFGYLSLLTPWRLGGFGDFRKKKQQFSVALPTP